MKYRLLSMPRLRNTSRIAALVTALLTVVSAPSAFAINPEPPGPHNRKGKCAEGKAGTASFYWYLNVGSSFYEAAEDLLSSFRYSVSGGQNLGSLPPSLDNVMSAYYGGGTINRSEVSLQVETASITADNLDPASLSFNPGARVETVKVGDILRQIVTDDTFVDIIPQTVGFTVKVYDKTYKSITKTSGLYTLASVVDPFYEVAFTTNDGSAYDDTLQIVSIDRRSSSVKVEFKRFITNSITDSVTEETYTGTLSGSTPALGIKIEEITATYSARGSRPYDYTLIKETKRATTSSTIAGVPTYGSLVVVERTLDQYADYSLESTGGDARYKRLLKHIDGYGSTDPRETNYTWYDQQSNEHIHGRLKTVINPNQSWEYHTYTDSPYSATAQEIKYEGWKDQLYSPTVLNSAKKTVTAINSSNSYTRTVTIGSQMIEQERKTFATISGGKTLKTEKKIGSEWETEITAYHSQSAATLLAGRPMWTQHADGTYTTYAYSLVSGDLQVIEMTGAGSSGSITSGTQLTKIYNQWNEQISEEVKDISSGLVLNSWLATIVDAIGRPTYIIYNENLDDYETFQYYCCGLGYHRRRDASVNHASYDHFRRKVWQKSDHYDGDANGIVTTTTYDGLTNSTSTGGLLMDSRTVHLNGETASVRGADQDGDGDPEETTFVYNYPATGGKIVTQTNPDGGKIITASFVDEQQKSVGGTAVAQVLYDYGTHNENGGGLSVTTYRSTSEWEKVYFDLLGRNIRVEYPTSMNFETGVDQTLLYYSQSVSAGSRGNLASKTDPDGITVTYTYDIEGRLASKTEPINAILSKITSYEYDVVDDSGIGGIGVSERKKMRLNGNLVETSLKSGDGYRNKQSLIGRGTTMRAKSVSDVEGNSTDTITYSNGTKHVTTTTGNRLTSITMKATNGTTMANVIYTYDALDRVSTAADARTGATIYSNYTNAGRAKIVTLPGNRTTNYSFDEMGRQVAVDAPDTSDPEGGTFANLSYISYYPTGEVKATWGDQGYSAYYIYDSLNRKKSMRTYQALANGSEPTFTTTGYSQTTWNYDDSRGFLISKEDADDKGVSFTYTAAGRLKSRIWARGVATVYGYTNGLLTTIEYSDNTPNVNIVYDAFGRQLSVTQQSQSHVSFTYDAATLGVDTETCSYDLDRNGTYEFTRVLDRKNLDSAGRDKGWELIAGGTIENEVIYTYNSTSGRLQSVSCGDLGTFDYSYVDNSANLLGYVNGPVHQATNHWMNDRDVLESKENEVGTIMISRYEYDANDIGQRTNVDASGAAFGGIRSWEWSYNVRGEVTKADSSVATYDRSYQYDTIGNRVKSADSLILPANSNYAANLLNQYTAVGALVPTYDDDGNATAYPVPYAPGNNTAFTWDAENRMATAENTTLSPFITVYSYDAGGRLIGRFNIGTGGWTYYVYDGWNRIAEYNSGGAIARTYSWGADLSGSFQGGGGVRGLLAVCHQNESGNPVFYPTYDGNGNVSEYLNTSGAVVAHFEYDLFGRTVVNTDTSGRFRYRFSTKPQDSFTGLYYYGARFYDPMTGRWPSRDSVEESGGYNLYGFLDNDGINRWDLFGQKPCSEYSKSRSGKTPSGMEGRTSRQNDAKIVVGPGPEETNACGEGDSDVPEGFPALGWLIGYKVRFTGACATHDKCYQTCGKSKAECDVAFALDMQEACKSADLDMEELHACLLLSSVYFRGVALPSSVQKGYESAQDFHCEWECCDKD